MGCCSTKPEENEGTERAAQMIDQADQTEHTNAKRIVLIAAALLVTLLLITSLPLAHGAAESETGLTAQPITHSIGVPEHPDADIRSYNTSERT